MSDPDLVEVLLHWNERDVAAMTELQRTGGHRTLNSVIAAALRLYWDHVQIGPLPPGTFERRDVFKGKRL